LGRLTVILCGRDTKSLESKRLSGVEVLVSLDDAESKNTAASISSGDTLCFLGENVVFDDETIAELISIGSVSNSFVCDTINCFKLSIMLKRRDFFDLGGFRDFFVGKKYEEHDLCKRLCSSGLVEVAFSFVYDGCMFDPQWSENDFRAEDEAFQLRWDIKNAGYLV